MTYDVEDTDDEIKGKSLELIGKRLSCLRLISVFYRLLKTQISQFGLVTWRIAILSNSVTGDYALTQVL